MLHQSKKQLHTQPLSSTDCAFSLCKVGKAYCISLVDKAAQMCACECACMCACIQLWALKQAWIHTSTSSLGFECDPCEIEREGARAEGWLTLLPPLLAVAWGWFPDDVKQCSKSSAPPTHTHIQCIPSLLLAFPDLEPRSPLCPITLSAWVFFRLPHPPHKNIHLEIVRCFFKLYRTPCPDHALYQLWWHFWLQSCDWPSSR